jgi:uncharacterized protein YjaG (DUF416 family)
MIDEEKSLVPLSTLSWKKQLSFALLVFERMMPSLTAFSKDTGFDAACYLKARDAAWAALLSPEDGNIDQSLNEACLRSAPDTEAFSHELTSYALNAALAMSDILEFMLDSRTDHITYISGLAIDSVHLYLSSLGSSVVSSLEKDRETARHPLLRKEQHRQAEDVRFLSALPDQFDNDTVSALRARASTQDYLLPPAPMTGAK